MITAAGYFDVGKSLIQSVLIKLKFLFKTEIIINLCIYQIAGAILTYIIVMLQFNLGEKTIVCTSYANAANSTV